MTTPPLMLAGMIAALAIVSAPPPGAQASQPYEVRAVSEGGSARGQVRFSGTVPHNAVERIQITKNPEVCGDVREIIHIDVKDTALRGTFVYLDHVTRGKDWPLREEKYVLEQKGCRFSPWAQIVKPGAITVRNSDEGIHHNVHTSELINPGTPAPIRRTLFKFGQPDTGDIIERLAPANSPHLSVKCEVHNFMFGWIMAPSHPYATVVDAQGNFILENIPAGSYVLTAWHPKLGFRAKTIEVSASGSNQIDFEFSQSAQTTSD